MKKLLFLLLITNFSLLIAEAQSRFQRTIGSEIHDGAYSIIQTTDGGYAAAGYTNSFGAWSGDFYIIKLNNSGTLQWSRTIGGANNERAYSIIQTTDGGYAVAGGTSSFGAWGYDFYIVKLDVSGELQWSTTIGGTDDDNARCIIQTADNGYAVAGSTQSFGGNMYIVKLDVSGELQWSKTVGGTYYDYASSIIQTTDGGYAVAGGTSSFGAWGYDFYIVKLDVSGELQWSTTIGGTDDDNARCIIQTADNGYAVCGQTYSFGAGENDVYIVKLNATGAILWSRAIGTISSDGAHSIIQTKDGGYAVAGSTDYFDQLYDMYIVKFDGNGTPQWNRTVGGAGWEYGYSIIQTTDGGYAVAGKTGPFGAGLSDMYIVKFDNSWNTCGNTSTPFSINGSLRGRTTHPTSIITSPTPTITTPTPIVSSGGTVTTICVIGIQPISNELPVSYELYQNYPNPFNPVTKIKFDVPSVGQTLLSVYDVLGKEVAILVNEKLNPGTYEVTWDATNYPSGIYFYRIAIHSDKLTSENYSETERMMLIK